MSDPVEAYRAAVAAFERGDAAGSLALARALLRRVPGNAAVHSLIGGAAMRLGDARSAIDHLRQAAALDPGRVDHIVQLAHACLHAGEFAAARDAFARAVTQAPNDAGLHFQLATVRTFTGDLAGAVAAYETCVARDPTHWRAHLALAQARRWRAGDHHVDRLRALLATHGADADARLYLELALAKELEDTGEYAASFAHLAEGKAAHRARHPYDFARDRAMFDALCQVVPGHDDKAGDPAVDPIFVVGLPRTGTTLVDRILSSHPAVRSAGERFDFPRLLKLGAGSRTPSLLDAETVRGARALDWGRLGAAYLRGPRAATRRAAAFVDKLPHNFLYLGFIARALPRARIVCLRRERLDTCVANFRQLLSPDVSLYDYSFDLLDTGRYVLQFERLMAHWHAQFPGRILEVPYEALVDDHEAQVRRLVAHCGLAWDEACLAFERNPRAVATASAVQVREPLHRGAIGRWKHYTPQLAELRALFDDPV